MEENPNGLEGRVVVGFDGSAPAVLALDRAADEARRRSTALEILSGWPWNRHPLPEYGVQDEEGRLRYSSARRMMDAAEERARRRAPDILIVQSLTSEPAAQALLRCGSEAALTVVGTRGHGGFTGLLLGSVALRLAAHCVTPLMVVRSEAEPEHGTVVLGLASTSDEEAVWFAADEAVRLDAELRILHAWQLPPPHGVQALARTASLDGGSRHTAAEAEVQDALVMVRRWCPQVKVCARAVPLRPAQALVETSRSADVVVLAVHRRSRRFGLRLGPVSHAVLHHGHCPAVLVPTG